jgi:hypothetical protein
MEHSWTEVNNLNTARGYVPSNGGTQTNTIVAGGYVSTYVGNTETWNGTSWTEEADLSAARGWVIQLQLLQPLKVAGMLLQ